MSGGSQRQWHVPAKQTHWMEAFLLCACLLLAGVAGMMAARYTLVPATVQTTPPPTTPPPALATAVTAYEHRVTQLEAQLRDERRRREETRLQLDDMLGALQESQRMLAARQHSQQARRVTEERQPDDAAMESMWTEQLGQRDAVIGQLRQELDALLQAERHADQEKPQARVVVKPRHVRDMADEQDALLAAHQLALADMEDELAISAQALDRLLTRLRDRPRMRASIDDISVADPNAAAYYEQLVDEILRQLEEDDQFLIEQTSRLSTIEYELSASRQSVEHMQEIIMNQRELLIDKDELIAQKTGEVLDQDDQLRELESMLNDSTQELTQQDYALEEGRERLHRVRQELAEQSQQVSTLTQGLLSIERGSNMLRWAAMEDELDVVQEGDGLPPADGLPDTGSMYQTDSTRGFAVE